MKCLLFLQILFTLVSCNNQTKSGELIRDEGLSDEKKLDSSVSTDIFQEAYKLDTASKVRNEELESYDNISILGETERIYLDRVYYFKSTNEFYISLNFNSGYNYDSITSIRATLDTLVFEDIEVTRTSVPMELAHKYFDLTLVDELDIFNYSHSLIQTARLKRVEFFQDVIGDQFIAVYKSDEPQETFKFYGIGGTKEYAEDFYTLPTDKSEFISDLINKWQVKLLYMLSSSSFELPSFGTNIISFAFISDKNTAVTHIIEQKDDSIRKLLQVEGEFYIWEIIPTSLIYNSRPILLLWLGYPETDIEWYATAVFDGDEYKMMESSRIILEDFGSDKEGVQGLKSDDWDVNQDSLRALILDSKPNNLLKGSLLEELYIRGIAGISNDSVFVEIPFNLHSLDCGVTDCYTTEVHFAFSHNNQSLIFPQDLSYSITETGCVDSENYVSGEMNLIDFSAEYVNYYMPDQQSSLVIIRKDERKEYAYYFPNVDSDSIKVDQVSEILLHLADTVTAPYRSSVLLHSEYEAFLDQR